MSDQKKKVSIITAAPHVRNYGSVLMSYATCKLFESSGFAVEFVDYTRHTLEESESLSCVLNIVIYIVFFEPFSLVIFSQTIHNSGPCGVLLYMYKREEKVK